ncbi:nodulin homeobox-like isoform X1 [Camellia sinensis]|uniref:nodulin homeobox-like isoform X1 n=1 Tax=Camellia sinensis TaxID=4442 RepID=UPI001036085E|nr:nodulin homeobox-like isoform X1 [Camellia sinensis]XP_028052146.1 nodulin homeobox-like isoform X1 [Camellia sinensis]XP_028052154.1 nodulin homeobox-like isoform X1 [Camellia sinensis]
MRRAKEEPSSSGRRQAIDLISAVKELHRLSPQDLSKLIRDSENNILQTVTESGSSFQIDVEKLARFLPMHLMAKLMSSERDEALFKYLLCGIRLLHSLLDIAPRHSKLEQILLDDVKVSDQLLDLVFFLVIVLCNYRQEHHTSSPMPLLHSALVSCSLYLLTGCISSQWQDLASVLVVHSKVDIFMDAACAALRVDIKFLHIKLSGQYTDLCTKSSCNAEGTLISMCQQCEASLQFLQSLCQQKSFRERLVKNKELCGKGGILLLVRAILNLKITPLFRESSSVVAAVSRLKSKILTILLHLCEAESISYLDEIASTPQSMNLAKSVALEVLELLKTMFARDPKQLNACSDKNYPMGLLQLNAMRLADIFSDDSNFRFYITTYFTEVLTAIFSVPHQEFLSSWCSSDLPFPEEDATVEFDSHVASGCVLDSLSSSDLLNVMSSGFTLVPSIMPRASYAHQRVSLLVKIIANLHCFAPKICKEEKDVFLNKFLECLRGELPESSASDAEKARIVIKNLRSLLSHAESLTPPFLNDEDVQLLRVFFTQLASLICPAELEDNRVQEDLSAGGCSSPLLHKIGNLKECTSENSAFQEEDQFYVRGNCIDQTGDIVPQDKGEDKGKSVRVAKGLREIDRDIQNVETSGSDSSSTRGKNSVDHNVEFPNLTEHIKESGLGGLQEDEKAEAVQSEEKQRRKRKRTIMNDKQISLIERALLDEPDMQRNAASVQSWADKLSVHGPEVTTSKLKNWLNNRKARLARAAKDVRVPSEGGDNVFSDKQGGSGIASHYDSAESPSEDVYIPEAARGIHQSGIGESTLRTGTNEKAETVHAEFIGIASAGFVQCEPGQYVVLVDQQEEEIGKGKVHQAQGNWHGCNLEELEMCVVDVMELKVDRWMSLPHPCEATGNSFDEAEKKLGLMRVLWDSNKLFMLPPR